MNIPYVSQCELGWELFEEQCITASETDILVPKSVVAEDFLTSSWPNIIWRRSTTRTFKSILGLGQGTNHYFNDFHNFYSILFSSSLFGLCLDHSLCDEDSPSNTFQSAIYSYPRRNIHVSVSMSPLITFTWLINPFHFHTVTWLLVLSSVMLLCVVSWFGPFVSIYKQSSHNFPGKFCINTSIYTTTSLCQRHVTNKSKSDNRLNLSFKLVFCPRIQETILRWT